MRNRKKSTFYAQNLFPEAFNEVPIQLALDDVRKLGLKSCLKQPKTSFISLNSDVYQDPRIDTDKASSWCLAVLMF